MSEIIPNPSPRAQDGCAKIAYPEDLPVSAHRAEILAAVRSHPVTVVAGDTGSGKTTQLPKMMLELGRGAKGRRIAVTQPRRLAAVTMAERVADELGCELGDAVGFRHRYAKATTDRTRVEFLTDGVLLAETRRDPLLRAYDTVIVDEAHERTLNIDFLLGILKRILERRGDLRVIISSATMDTGKFAAFFGAPVIDVPGRLHPIELRYRPTPEDEERDLPGEVAAAVAELPREGDVLVFLSGERDIRETADLLRDRFADDDVIPLLASLPAAEQRRAFRTSPRRRIVLATNVAETSVTIPGIRAVIDSGLARISRYVHRTQVQRLQIEPVSQASARQRAGRCGRLGPGICIRLYSEEDFLRRDEYTVPEALRSSLAGVILTMLDLGLGDIERFPFVDPPKPAMVREGLRELLELGAIRRPDDGRGIALTAIGRKLARIPVEPRLARMLVAASDNAVLPSVLAVVAALACEDPRRRPMDEREKAARAHAKWRVAGSDFLGTLKLFDWWRDETANLSQSKARKLAKANYLAWSKMREWTDLERQLESLSRRMGLSFAEIPKGDDAYSAAFHMSLLAGLLGRVGRYHAEDREYRGTHALRFAIHPGSALRREAPEWIVAGELVDTARLFAREAAAIDPRWIEPVAGDILKHHVHSPLWDADSGFVRATERITLYGLPVVEARRCNYARFEPEAAREIFIRHALIYGEFPRPSPPVREAIDFLKALRERAERARSREIFDEERLLAHFAAALPPEITDANALRRYLSKANAAEMERFRLRRADWWPKNAAESDFPGHVSAGGVRLKLVYRNAPDDPERDGITCVVRRSDVGAIALWRSDWLVPGLLPKKLSYLLLSLPNSLQRLLKPLDDALAILADELKPRDLPFEEALRRAIYARWGFRIPEDAWANVRLPAYLSVRFSVTDDETGRVLVATRSKREALGLEDPTDRRFHPEPPEKTAADALEGRLPFSYRGKLPLDAALELKSLGYEETDFKRDLRECAIRATLAADGKTLKSEGELVRCETELARLAVESLAAVRRLQAKLESGLWPEATADSVTEQLAWLAFRGFPRLASAEMLRRYPRYLKGIEIRLGRARVSPASDRTKEERFAPYWQRYRSAAANRGKIGAEALFRYRWMVEDFRLQTFAPELRTFEPASPKRLDALIPG